MAWDGCASPLAAVIGLLLLVQPRPCFGHEMRAPMSAIALVVAAAASSDAAPATFEAPCF